MLSAKIASHLPLMEQNPIKGCGSGGRGNHLPWHWATLGTDRRHLALTCVICCLLPGLICKCRLDVNCRLSRQPKRVRRLGGQAGGHRWHSSKSGAGETFSGLEWSTKWCDLPHWLVAALPSPPTFPILLLLLLFHLSICAQFSLTAKGVLREDF